MDCFSFDFQEDDQVLSLRHVEAQSVAGYLMEGGKVKGALLSLPLVMRYHREHAERLPKADGRIFNLWLERQIFDYFSIQLHIFSDKMAAEYDGEIDVPESAIQIIDENVIRRTSALFNLYYFLPHRRLETC